MKSFGLDSSSLVPQTDFLAQQSEEGRWTASQSFLVLQSILDEYTGTQLLLPGTPATSLDENLPRFYQFLKFQNFEVRHQEAGWATITCYYVGFYSTTSSATGGTDPVTYQLSGVIEESPLMDHPKVVALADTEKDALGWIVEGLAVWDTATSKLGTIPEGTFIPFPASGQKITTSDGIAAAILLQQGQTSYKRPSYTWTKSEESTSPLAASDLNALGKIDTPEGSPPEASGSRDWMLVSADQLQRGTSEPIYSKTLTWVLSERGGWDSFLYGP